MVTERERAILAILFKSNPCCGCCNSDDDYRERIRGVVQLFDREEWRDFKLPLEGEVQDQTLRDIYVFGPRK